MDSFSYQQKFVTTDLFQISQRTIEEGGWEKEISSVQSKRDFQVKATTRSNLLKVSFNRLWISSSISQQASLLFKAVSNRVPISVSYSYGRGQSWKKFPDAAISTRPNFFFLKGRGFIRATLNTLIYSFNLFFSSLSKSGYYCISFF